MRRWGNELGLGWLSAASGRLMKGATHDEGWAKLDGLGPGTD